MRRPAALLIFSLPFAALAWGQSPSPAPGPGPSPPAQPAEAAREPVKRKPIYDEGADAKQQIEAALARAAKENRRVLIQWGGNWCVWCHLLHDTFESDRALKKKLRYEYDVVLVDSGKQGKNMDLAGKYGADLKTEGFPYLTVLDARGKAIANQETASLEVSGKTEDGHDAAKLLDFLTKHQAPPLNAEEVLTKGLADAAAEGKKVFLHFGAPWCGWCHRLEDWMARPEVAAVLGKDFVDVKIDIDRMTGGKTVLTRYRPEDGGIPWFAFVSPQGKALVTSDGPKGNVGFPYEPHEIDHFIHALNRARVKITEPEVDALRASLADRSNEKRGG